MFLFIFLGNILHATLDKIYSSKNCFNVCENENIVKFILKQEYFKHKNQFENPKKGKRSLGFFPKLDSYEESDLLHHMMSSLKWTLNRVKNNVTHFHVLSCPVSIHVKQKRKIVFFS